MEQSIGRPWVFVGISREIWDLRDATPPNKEKPFQTRKNTNRQGKHLSSKGYLPIKCKSLQVVGVSRQGKAVVSDGGYGVIGGGYCLLVWGDAEGTKGKRGRRWRGVGPAGRPSLFPLWR